MILDGDNEENSPLEVSDEDFLKIIPPTDKAPVETQEPKVVEEKEEEVIEANAEITTEEDNKTDDEVLAENKPAEPEKKPEEWKEFVPDTTKTDDENAAAKAEHDKTKPVESDESKDNEKNPDGTPKTTPEAEQVKPVNFEEAYNKIMQPLKANGKEIKINNIDEAIRLMQMGAGYSKKILNLQPHLKTIRMLEKNNLLDPNKLSFYIDLDKKNPEAIKKFIKDSGIDPLDLNTDDPVSYKPTDRTVSDNEMTFKDAIDEVTSLPGGQETIRIVNTTWDQKSKEALWESPEILGVIQSQRENGLYDQIITEIDRQKLLGHIPPNAPLLAAYKTAGDTLVKENRLVPPKIVPVNPLAPTEPTVIETRTAPVKSSVANSEKAKAAAPSQTTSRKATEVKNPLEMPDADFMKQFEGRL